MLVFKEVEKCLNDNGFKIIREKDGWGSCDWKIVFENPLIQYGSFTAGTFKDKDVIVVGGGNSAITEALYKTLVQLSEVESVKLLVDGKEL